MPDDVQNTQAAAEASATQTPGTENTQPVSSSESAPAQADNGIDSPQGSLTQPKPESATKPNAPTQQTIPLGQPGQPQKNAEPVDWQRRFGDLKSQTQRLLNQAKMDREQIMRETADLRAYRQQQEELAKQQNLRPWSKQHPDNIKFQGVLTRAKAVNAQLRSIDPSQPPEVQAAAKAAIMSALSPDEQKQLQDYQDTVQQNQLSLLEDPRGFIAPIIQPLVAEAIQQERMRMQADEQVGKDFEDPELKPLIDEHRPEIAKALQDGVPYQYAVHMLKMFGQLEKLQNQVNGMSQQAAMGQEQVRLAQGKSSITRDPAPNKSADVYTLAKKEAERRGFTTADPRFLALLSETEKAHSTL